MFKMFPFRTDAFTQSIAPPIHRSVIDNVVIKATSVFNRSFFQMILDAINVLVSTRSAASTTASSFAICRSSRISLCSRRFTDARDRLFSRKVGH